MDCIQAQEVISAALDKTAIEQAVLDEAKSHCRGCSSCTAFVKTLLAVQSAKLPTPPADLADRIMSRVQAESAEAAQAASTEILIPAVIETPVGASTQSTANVTGEAKDGLKPGLANAEDASADTPARSWGELFGRAWHPRNRRAFIAWSAAAAVLFVAAGIGALSGVRAILVPQRMTAGSEATDMALSSSSTSAEKSDTSASSSVPESGTQGVAPAFIAIDSLAYRLTGPARGIDDTTLKRLGTTRSALDGGGAARSRTVMVSRESSSAATVYLESADGQLLTFEQVTRAYGGRPYALQSGQIDGFGSWPTLPAGIREPGSADGAPVFEQDGTDERGTPVYRMKGSDAENGIAVGPGAPTGDPVAGSPVWTWWAPQQ